MEESKIKSNPRVLDLLSEDEKKEYYESYSDLKEVVENKDNPKSYRKIAQAIINLSDLIYLSDNSSDEFSDFSLEDIFNQVLGMNKSIQSLLKEKKSEKETEFEIPKWWPKTDAKKYKYRHLHKKIKPLYDKGRNYSQIAEELGIDRHEVSHILTWFQKSPEAHGK